MIERVTHSVESGTELTASLPPLALRRITFKRIRDYKALMQPLNLF